MKRIQDALFDDFESTSARASAAIRIVTAPDVSARCEALLDFYRSAFGRIVAKPGAWGIDPYEVRWGEVFTPIEAAMWHELRRANLVFYPQLPVGRSFVDFGDPLHKIAIECDGKEFHLDVLKDRERDLALSRRGWQVLRISGADCLADGDEDDDGSWPTPIRRFVTEIAQRIAAIDEEAVA